MDEILRLERSNQRISGRFEPYEVGVHLFDEAGDAAEVLEIVAHVVIALTDWLDSSP